MFIVSVRWFSGNFSKARMQQLQVSPVGRDGFAISLETDDACSLAAVMRATGPATGSLAWGWYVALIFGPLYNFVVSQK